MNTKLFSHLTVLFLCCVLQACTMDKRPAHGSPNHADLDQARAVVGVDWPQDSAARPTTSGDIYLANLESQIAALQQRLARRSDDISVTRLALARYHRFQVVGLLEDAEKARSLLSTASGRPHSPVVDLAYAEVLLGFHEFTRAYAALETASNNDADSASVARMRRALNRATGHTPSGDEHTTVFTESLQTPVALVTQAAQLIERGHAAEATNLLKAAQDSYHDSAPYLLAWIQVQQGIVFLRYRDFATAHIFFAAAHQRFPQYAVATEHLAETELALGNHRIAIDLYRHVATQTGNPEFYYRLASAERALGDFAASEMHERQAREGYEVLLASHPLMYADHAARYYMEIDEVETALDLAQQNFVVRQDIRARTLLLEAQLLAENFAAACAEFATIRSLNFAPPELSDHAELIRERCST